jgi:osmotically-inducible protein OsmY
MSRNATSDRTAGGTLLSGYTANGSCVFHSFDRRHRSPDSVERTLAVEQIMQSLERLTGLILALARSFTTSPLFAALDPIPVRERLRIPRPGPGGWYRYPGFAGPRGRSIGRSLRVMFLVSVAMATLGVATDARAADRTRASASADNIEDARRQTQIATVYAINPLLRDSVLIVTVTGANASIVGKTGSTVQRDLAEEIAMSVDGIEHVDNMIGITDMPMLLPRGDTSFGQKIDDATTTAAIRSKLLWGAKTSGLAVQVATVRGNVRLYGTVYESAQKDLVAQVARDTAGALSVTNGIVVFAVPPVTSGAQADAQKILDDRSRPVSDSWITARVRSTFQLSPSMNRSAITVATSEGTVSLSGVADSPGARMSAIALAGNTRGVHRVDSTRLVAN